MTVGRYVYLNGQMVKEDQARLSPFDRGFLWGDGVYEITPCFNRRLYRLADHLERLYRSFRYVRIDPGMDRTEMEKATLTLLEANVPHLEEESIYKVGHWVTRGMDNPSMAARKAGPPTVFISGVPSTLDLLPRCMRRESGWPSSPRVGSRRNAWRPAPRLQVR